MHKGKLDLKNSHEDAGDCDPLFSNRFSRGEFLAALAAAGLSATLLDTIVGAESPLPALAAGQAHYLCLIVLDGFRPDYLNLANMPAFHALASRGISYDRAWVGQLESETPTGHATIGTGSFPRHNGVIGFEWRDPVSRREVLDGWEQGSLLGQVGRDMRHANVHSLAGSIKAARSGIAGGGTFVREGVCG